MIDIHTHILPGVDDGAADWEETLRLARAAVQDGITAVIATPHHLNGRYDNLAKDVRPLVDQTNERLNDAGIPLRVTGGQEIRVRSGLPDAWERGELLSLSDSSYLLIELPSSHIPDHMGELMHELGVLGLVPVIAHPERNAAIARDHELLAELVADGAIAQVTSHSLVGGFGRGIEKIAWSLCRRGLIHVVSSDAHHVERRAFRLSEAYDAIGKRLGEEKVRYYQANAERIASNLPVERFEGLSEKGSPFHRFLSKFK